MIKLKDPGIIGGLTTLGSTPDQAVGASKVEEIVPAARVQRLTIPAGQSQAAVDALRRRPDVEFAQVEHPVRASQLVPSATATSTATSTATATRTSTSTATATALPLTPNDTSYGSQWALPKIQAPLAWGVSTGGAAKIIAIVDTGIQLDHPDLSARIVSAGGANCATTNGTGVCTAGTTQGADDNGHGTHVAGIAAAVDNNGVGIAGVAYSSAVKLLPVKVLDSSGSGWDGDVAAGITWAADPARGHANVINLSLGGTGDSSAIDSAIDYAYSQGVLVAVAAGNTGASGNAAEFPAGYARTAPRKLIPVAATSSDDTIASFSTEQDYVRTAGVSAPGNGIYSTYLGSTYRSLSGTSMATPHVAGLAALLWSANANLTVDDIHNAILNGVDDQGASGPDIAFGAGRINAYRSMILAFQASAGSVATPTTIPSATATLTSSQTPAPTSTSVPTATSAPAATSAPTAVSAPAPSSGGSGGSSGGSDDTSSGGSSSGGGGGSSGGGSSGGSSGGGSSSGGSSTAQPAKPIHALGDGSSSSSATAVPSFTVATTATGGVQVTNGAIQISGSDGSAITAAVATIDPVTGHRRFNGWVRSDSGPIFGITEQGKLEWVAPDDMQSLNEIDWGKVQTIPDDALTSVPLTQPHAGWLLWNFRGGGQIYVVGDDGQLHYIPDWHTFEVQFQWKNVLPVSAGQVKQIPVGPSVPSSP